MKTCPKCGISKPLCEFNKNRSKIYGVQTYCRTCIYPPKAKKCPKPRTPHKYDKAYYNINRVIMSLRSRVNNALKRESKRGNTLSLIGCSIEQLKKYLQETALNNGYKYFDINTYNGNDYHIDHIIPCSAWNLKCSYHQKLCFNWENLQILSSIDNLYKGDKLQA